MDVKVTFRFNQLTGEVEVFEVTDEGTMRLSEAEHNREHDRIAAELGNILERNPRITEVFPNSPQLEQKPISEPEISDETFISPQIQEQNQRQVE